MVWNATLRRIVLLLALAAAPAVAQDRLDGRYSGVESASGAQIDIAPDQDGFRGTFQDASGQSQDFAADRDGDAAQAVLDMAGRTVLMRMVPMPYGAEVALVPVTPDGAVQLDQAQTLHFLRPGLTLPDIAPDFVAAPADPQGRITGNSFLASYEFWDPAGVRNGYLALPDRMKTLLRFFPAVQLDVIWKLCLAPDADAALGVALRGAQVDCAVVIAGLADSQRSGRFDAFKAEVAAERATLRQAVRCADRYPEPKEVCDQSSREIAAAAVSLKTAGSVLDRYR